MRRPACCPNGGRSGPPRPDASSREHITREARRRCYCRDLVNEELVGGGGGDTGKRGGECDKAPGRARLTSIPTENRLRNLTGLFTGLCTKHPQRSLVIGNVAPLSSQPSPWLPAEQPFRDVLTLIVFAQSVLTSKMKKVSRHLHRCSPG